MLQLIYDNKQEKLVLLFSHNRSKVWNLLPQKLDEVQSDG